MLKFIRGKGQQPSAERQRLQKELYAYRKTTQHGFPHKPSALAYDPVSRLMAIGTQTGVIKVFGQPGVEFYGQHVLANNSCSELNVQLIEWVYGTGRLLSLTAANQLILWEPVGATLVAVKSLPFEGKLKKVSSMCCSRNNDIVWIGTEGGNIYQFDLQTFDIKEPVIYHDVVLEQVPPTYKLNPGAIESIRQLPNDRSKLLIAYNRGLCVLWDLETSMVQRAYIAPGHGQSVGLYVHAKGTQFTWYHADGSFATWSLAHTDPPTNVNYVPYGPDPCKSINRLFKAMRGSVELSIFSGGMPRSAFGDHNCVSIHSSDGRNICLDFTSKVIDFFVTYGSGEIGQNAENVAEVLIVLLEEELCAFDLTNPKVPSIKAPYLHSVHASAVTCLLTTQISEEVYEKILKAGQIQDHHIYSDMEWPINGGEVPSSVEENGGCSEESDESPIDNNKKYEILLTGHEDGSVKFWDCTGVALKPIYNFKTAPLFGSEQLDELPPLDNGDNSDPSEPPFRKAGLFDPYSDDPRLAVKKVVICSKTGRLVVGGTAGQIITAYFPEESDESSAPSLKVSCMNLVSDRDGFVWKGHDPLNIVEQQLLKEDAAAPVANGSSGMHITGVVQVLPPASITCLAVEANWGLLAAGTAHGLILFDFANFMPVFHRCTLNPNDLTGAGEQLSRRKSFKKSLRESFRKLRKGRSTRNAPSHQMPTTLEARPVERQVEARSMDDGMGSMVRCLLFAKTFITNVNSTMATLWSATNASTVSVFLLHLNNNVAVASSTASSSVSSGQRRVTAQLAKEIQLKHRAPVVGISIFDATGFPVDQMTSTDSFGQAPHRLLIASEEQFKVFSLPQLKPINKYKLTANEGARVRRIHFANFYCRVPSELLQAATMMGSPIKSIRSQHEHSIGGGDAATHNTDTHNTSGNVSSSTGNPNNDQQLYHETALVCLTNLGDITVLSVPDFRRQLNAAAVRREDINGISMLCFTNSGEALYMMSSSELQRISLSTDKVIVPQGTVDLQPLKIQESIAEDAEDEDQTSNVDNITNGDPDKSNTNSSTGVLNGAQQGSTSNESSATTSTAGSSVAMNKPGTVVMATGGTTTTKPLEVQVGLTNGQVGSTGGTSSGEGNSPNRANETIGSSMGDITVDSVRDHLNSTTTTLLSTTTEETVGRLSVLSTQTHQTQSSAAMKDIPDINISNLMDLAPLSNTTETNSSSVVVKSVITSISHEKMANGEAEITTTKTTTNTRSESQI